MTGPELKTFYEEVNGGASIGSTLLFQLINLAKPWWSKPRPWAVLRCTDTSKSVTTAGTWQVVIYLSLIMRFGRRYGKEPVTLFDGLRSYPFRQMPWHQRLSYKDTPRTFVLR